MFELSWDQRTDLRRVQDLHRIGRRGFAGRTDDGSSYATGEDTTVDYPYRRVIARKLIQISERARMRGRR